MSRETRRVARQFVLLIVELPAPTGILPRGRTDEHLLCGKRLKLFITEHGCMIRRSRQRPRLELPGF